MDFGKIGMVEEWLDSRVLKYGPATPWYEAWEECMMMSFSIKKMTFIMRSWYKARADQNV